jgi:hypothetical protein
MEKALGAYSSIADYRDGLATASVTPGSSFELPPFVHTDLGSVMDQNKIPACVSHSIVYLLRLYWYRKLGRWIDFSPRFIDILSDESWIPFDGGRVPRTGLKVAMKYGCATTATLPNDTEGLTISEYRNKNAISPAAYAEALKYRIPGFIRVPVNLLATKQAIALYGAVSALYTVGNELWTPSWQSKDIEPLRTPKSAVSGHQMTPNGYDPVIATLRNQWSIQWANQGEAHYDFNTWAPYTSEQWAIAQIPPDVADFLKTLPSASNFNYSWNTSLAQGMNNEDVKFLQIALMILGNLAPVNPADLGIYGPKTAVAVAKFQSQHKIPNAPGNVGPMTRAALNKIFSI